MRPPPARGDVDNRPNAVSENHGIPAVFQQVFDVKSPACRLDETLKSHILKQRFYQAIHFSLRAPELLRLNSFSYYQTCVRRPARL